MTTHQLSTERSYRIQERLAILQSDSPDAVSIATREADLWESRYLLSRILDQRHNDTSTTTEA